MNSLKSYLAMIEPRLINSISGKSKEFIKAFQDNNFLSEESFIDYVCDGKHDRRYYFNLKDKVVKTLQAFAIVSDSYSAKKTKKKLDLCRRNFIIAKKLLSKGEVEEGIRTTKLAYEIATRYSVLYIACETSSLLFHNYTFYSPSPRRAEFYARQVQKYLKDYAAEKNAEYWFYKVLVKMNGSLHSIEFDKALNSIENQPGDSLKYSVYKFMIQTHQYMYTGEYDKVINSCDEILVFLKTREGVFSSYYHFFLFNKSIAQTATKQFAAAFTSLQEAEKHAPVKSYNDYLIRLYKTINALHAGDYELAYKLYIQNRNCRFEAVKQQFAIIEAYLNFLFYMGHLNTVKRFRMGKYLNETFKAEAENQGNNINIFIAELLVYFSRNRGKFIDRIEAIENYSYKHLRGKDTTRAKRFIKILSMLPAVNFHPVALQRKAATHIQYLNNHPIRTGQNISIEIIPFELLLEMILQKLARKVA